MIILRKFIYLVVILILIYGCRTWIESHIDSSWSQDGAHLAFLGSDLDNYTTVTGKMPSDIKNRDGKPLLSWRVDLLQHGTTEDFELYKQFKLDEPWNSPHNLKLAQTVPFMYIDPKGPKCTPISEEQISPMWKMDPKTPNYTPYLGVTGQTAAIRPEKAREIVKGQNYNRAAVVVVEKSDVLWTEPRDITLENAKKGDSLRWYGGDVTTYLTAKGSPRHWYKNADRIIEPRSGQVGNEPPNYEFESGE